MGSVKSPPPRDYAKETRDTLEAQIELAPDLFSAEANKDYGRAAYAQLDLDVLRQVMEGTEDSPGLLQMYEDEIMPRLAAADAEGRRVSREADIQDVENLGARATEAFRQSDPNQAALVDELNRQAMEDLQAGANLPPSLARELEQYVRGGQASRGMGYGIADVSQEALVKGLQAEQLQRRRQQFARDTIGTNIATGADPFMAILGRPGVQLGQAAGITGQGGAMNSGSMFNPESAYAGSLYTSNFNAANQAAIASANNKAGMIGGGVSMLGSLGGGMLGGAGQAGGFSKLFG